MLTREVLERVRELCIVGATGSYSPAQDAEYKQLRQSLLASRRYGPRLPAFLDEGANLSEVKKCLQPAGGYESRRVRIREGMDPLLRLVGVTDQPDFAKSADEFCSKIVQLLMARGLTRAVGVLTFSRPSLEMPPDPGGSPDEGWTWNLRLGLTIKIFTRLDESSRAEVEKQITDAAREVVRGANKQDGLYNVEIYLDSEPIDDWKTQALAWLRGEGINNQGRVYSANLPVRQVEGLFFRSKPEVNLFYALKKRGVVFAPLPVFLRGGEHPKRIEPDFFIISDGIAMIVEVDGDAFHHENPVEADERVRMMKHHGVQIERVRAEDCATADGADKCADAIVKAFESYRRSL